MITQIIKTTLMCVGTGFLLATVNNWLGSTFLDIFLKENLVTILIALLAINATTIGVVLTKVRELIDKEGQGSECFNETKQQMLLSIKEQISLVIISILLLSLQSSPYINSSIEMSMLINSVLIGVFIYSLIILYDIAKGVLIIVDY
jgi:hypothetical protein